MRTDEPTSFIFAVDNALFIFFINFTSNNNAFNAVHSFHLKLMFGYSFVCPFLAEIHKITINLLLLFDSSLSLVSVCIFFRRIYLGKWQPHIGISIFFFFFWYCSICSAIVSLDSIAFAQDRVTFMRFLGRWCYFYNNKKSRRTYCCFMRLTFHRDRQRSKFE